MVTRGAYYSEHIFMVFYNEYMHLLSFLEHSYAKKHK